MTEPTIVSLCSGYEGLGMGVMAVLGGRLVAVADNDPGAAKILTHRFPSVRNLGDITETDWAAQGPVDVLCAGFPCQDVSCAGARKGLRKGTRTGVWAHVARAIEELRPSLVVLENVRGLLSAGADSDMEPCAWCVGEAGDELALRAAGAVCGDLASLLYDTVGTVVSAADAGAPHRRERIFILGWPAANGKGLRRRPERQQRRVGAAEHLAADSGRGDASDSGGAGPEVGPVQHHGPELAATERGDRDRPAADAEREPVRVFARGLSAAPGAAERPRAKRERLRADDSDGSGTSEDPDRPASSERRLPAPGQAPGGWPRADAGRPGGAPVAADAPDRGWDELHDGCEPGAHDTQPGSRGPCMAGDHRRSNLTTADPERHGHKRRGTATGETAGWTPAPGIGRGSADSGITPAQWGAYAPAIARWERVLGWPAPRPTEPGRTGERLSPAFVEFLMGVPEGWVTDVPGLSRNAQLKALGNGCVPQQVALALTLLLPHVPPQALAFLDQEEVSHAIPA